MRFSRRKRFPCFQPGKWATNALSHTERLGSVHSRGPGNALDPVHAHFGLLPHAESLAFRALARVGRSTLEFHAADDIHACAAMAQSPSQRGMMMGASRCWPRTAFSLGLRKPPAMIAPRATTAHSAALHHRGHVCSRHAITQTTAFSATNVPVPFLARHLDSRMSYQEGKPPDEVFGKDKSERVLLTNSRWADQLCLGYWLPYGYHGTWCLPHHGFGHTTTRKRLTPVRPCVPRTTAYTFSCSATLMISLASCTFSEDEGGQTKRCSNGTSGSLG